ncbi:hypothetical protein KL942_000003 [Ogataea angusta]|uniref:NADP-dependent oxidoreductase domain-containing protein n=1 Tax=Pichia angusta TaxID=870730 RepID=A0ABQ7S4N8_PICAN|nr:hypothetical protein KL942_000003 [Ogataea angusta]KAG7852941.1 hypothetical protein KL940_000642 [Ogataea angusta]
MTSVLLALNTGALMPAIGLGTWSPDDRSQIRECVEYAILEAGYRHIDTAYLYGCEDQVGEAVRNAIATGKVTREELFITTKVWPTFHKRMEDGLDLSLKASGLDYFDLVLVHWPIPVKCDSEDGKPFWPTNEDGYIARDTSSNHITMYQQLEKCLENGKAKAIGVSNYSIPKLESLLKECKYVPAVNQCELHPLLPRRDLCDFSTSKGIVMTSYFPFGGDGAPILKNEAIAEIAEKYSVSSSTILLSYHVNLGVSVVPKSFKPHRIKLNGKIVYLQKEDLKKLIDIGKEKPHRFNNINYDVDLEFGKEDW